MNVIAVLAVVEQRDAIFAIAQVSPALRADLEHGFRLARVLMGRPPEVAELDLVRRLARADRHRKGDLEYLVPLTPLDDCLETQHSRTGVQRHQLEEPRVAETSREAKQSAQSAAMHLNLLYRRHVSERVAVLGVEIPRVPHARVVVVQLEQVPGTAQDLAPNRFVPYRCEHRAVVPFDAEQLVLHAVA